ncbi:MAG: hypothetical protein HY301_07010 [Verrucomicrobia bacterium]|nr:hypothetical protein [Verrucomicrobiota bacterium]
MKRKITLLLAAGWFIAAAVHAADPESPPATGGITHAVIERAFDGEFTLERSTRRVDANSDLEILFSPTASTTAGDPGVEWRRATNLLALLNQRIAERTALINETRNLPTSDPKSKAVKDLNQRIDEFNARAADEPERWQQLLGLTNSAGTDQWKQITSGAFDGRRNRVQPYANLARWLTNELTRLNRDARDFVRARTVQVTVQAFHNSLFSGTKALHVDGYDNIASGDYQPIDRTGVRLTPAEQEQLAAKIKANESIAQGLRELQEKHGDLQGFFKAELAKLNNALDELVSQLHGDHILWNADLETTPAAKRLAALSADATKTGEVRKAATDLLAAARKLKAEIDGLSTFALRVKKLRDGFTAARPTSLADLTSFLASGANDLKSALDSAAEALKPIPTWPDRVKTMEADLAVLGAEFATELHDEYLPKAVRSFVADFSKEFPKTADAVKTLADFASRLAADHGDGAALDALADAKTEPIWHDANDAVKGRVELTRAGLAPGDRIDVRVRYRAPGTNGVPGRVISDEDYKVETVLMGLHRKFDASVIFARGLRGNAAEHQWKPSVAATVTWHYRNRFEDTFGQRAWNWLNPGFGLHLASLNQGPDSVEFGAGVNVSLWDGVLQGGYGYNLSNHEHPYVFFGLGLLQTLEKAKGSFK